MSFFEGLGKPEQATNSYFGFTNAKAGALIRPQSATDGVAGFLFDIPEGEEERKSVNLTEHYTESGAYISDHITQKPITLSLRGVVGERVYGRPTNPVTLGAEIVQNRLTQLDGMVGHLSGGALSTLNAAIGTGVQYITAAEEFVGKTKNLFTSFLDRPPEPTRQEEVYNDLSAMMDTQQLLSVSLPWSHHENMVIVGLTFTQGGESSDASSISIELKELRNVEVFKDLFLRSYNPYETQNIEEPETKEIRAEKTNASFYHSIYTAFEKRLL